MSVLNRKLFANREARTRLRDMGGIMSSFPELSGEVQKFQDGQEVRVTGSGMTPANVVPPITYQEWLRMSRREREAAGLPVSPLEGELYFNRFGVGLGLNDPQTGERLSRTVLEQIQEEAANPDPWGFGSFAPTSGSLEARRARALLGEAMFSGLRGPAEAAASIPIGAGALIGDVAGTIAEGTGTVASTLAGAAGLPGASESLQEAAEPPERAQPVEARPEGSYVDETDDERAARTWGEGDQPVAGEGATGGEGMGPDGERVGGTEIDISQIIANAQEAMTELAGEDDTSLRDRYEDRLALFQEVFGADEQSARDRSMALAMIGLAIAAGQSPNALTNIASGALAGLQAMSEQEQARRDRQRDVRGLALEAAMGEQAAEREAAAREAQISRAELHDMNMIRLRALLSGGGEGGANYGSITSWENAVRAEATLIYDAGEADTRDEALRIAANRLREAFPEAYGQRQLGGAGQVPSVVPEDATPEEAALLTGA